MTVGLISSKASTATPTDQWQFLKLGNGGICTNFDIHSDGTKVCTTDSFGAYIWSDTLNHWVQLLNTSIMPAAGLTQEGGGVDDIRIDPQNSSKIWMSFFGNFYKSTNRGQSFTKLSGYTVANLSTNTGSPVKGYGPYIAIDPNNSLVVYISTPAQGVQRTVDGGTTWTTITATNSGLPPYRFSTPTLPVLTTSTSSNSVGTGAKVFTTAASISYNPGSTYLKVWQTSNPANNIYGLLSGSNPYTITVPANSAFGSGSGITDWSFSNIIDGSNSNNNCGGHCIAFDTSASTVANPLGGVGAVTKNIYISTYGIGVYFSSDGGSSWSLLNTTGMPAAVKRMKISSTGVLWVVDDMYGSFSNASKYASGAWTTNIQIDLIQRWCTSVAIDPSDPNSVTYIQNDQPTVLRTADGGTIWVKGAGSRATRPVVSSGDVDWLAALYTLTDGFANCDAQYDPSVSGKIWTGAEGIWYFTTPTVAGPVTFTQQSRGIEQFIGNNVMSLPNDSGFVLLSTWDIPCFSTGALTSYPDTASGTLGNAQAGVTRGYCFDYCWNQPDTVIAIFQDGSGTDSGSGISRNGKGRPGTWRPFPSIGNSSLNGGHIAAVNDHTFVWVSTSGGADGANAPPQETTDGGKTWAPIVIPGGTPLQGWQPFGAASTYSKAIESDKTNGDLYLFNSNTGLTSANPGVEALFKRTASTGVWSIVKSPTDFAGEKNFNSKFRSVPGSYGLTGHMWWTGGQGAPPHPQAGRPLYYTTDGWSTSHTVANFTECAAVGFGASFPGHSGYPTVFVAGWLSGVYGVWMCKDFNTGTGVGTWTQCGPTSGTLADGNTYSLPLNIVGVVADIDGDKTIPGQVYIQTVQSGAFWGKFS